VLISRLLLEQKKLFISIYLESHLTKDLHLFEANGCHIQQEKFFLHREALRLSQVSDLAVILPASPEA